MYAMRGETKVSPLIFSLPLLSTQIDKIRNCIWHIVALVEKRYFAEVGGGKWKN